MDAGEGAIIISVRLSECQNRASTIAYLYSSLIRRAPKATSKNIVYNLGVVISLLLLVLLFTQKNTNTYLL